MTEVDQAAAEKTYRAIGRFIFEFSQVEYALRHYLAEEIGLKDEHFVAVAGSYDVGMLTTVVREAFKKTRRGPKIEALLSKFRTLNDERNRVAHGLWVPFMDGGTVHYVSRSSLYLRRLTDQARALEELADDACSLRAELESAFTLSFEISLPISP